MFRKILIANRGEIAVRIMRACREMGVRAVAVFSEVDRKALHVLKADEAYPIGAAPATESYLRVDKIIEVARKSGAEAIHPGYGFLAENPELARACDEAGIVFIGPSASAMELMGAKTRAREAAVGAGGEGVVLLPRAKVAQAAFRDAGSEAENAFGDPEVFLEKYLEHPRHIEIQI